MKAFFKFVSVVLLILGAAYGYSERRQIERYIHGGSTRPAVRLTQLRGKVLSTAGKLGFQLLFRESADLVFDAGAVLASIFDGEAQTGLPPGDIPVLMVVNKQANDVRYWKLTDNVRMVRVSHDDPGAIELKVMNELPLRVELWLSSEKEVTVQMELK